MSVNIISRPSITLPSGFLNYESKWWAVWNPIVYQFQRRDYEIVSITDSGGGTAKVILSPGYIMTDMVGHVNNLVYINSGPYNGTFQIFSISLVGLNIEFNISGYLGDTTGGYVNDIYERKGWYVEVFIYKHILTPPSEELLTSLRFSGDKTGLVKANISRPLQSCVNVNNESDYASVAYLDQNAFVYFHIKYQEFWLDSATTLIEDLTGGGPRRYFATNSVRQIQQANGSNMAAFISGLLPKGKFICDFNKPTYFQGYPFDMAYIFSDLSVMALPNREIDKLNSAGTIIGHTSDPGYPTPILELDGLQAPGETRITIPGGYASDVKDILLWMDSGDPFVSRYVAEDYVDNQYVEAVTSITPGVYRMTEKRKIAVDQECYDNPVYLAWKGSQGGWNYWLFSGDQKLTTETSANGEFEPYISDMENAEGKVEWLNKKSQPYMQLGANSVDVANFDGMQGIMESVKVQMLISLSPVKWTTVKVRPNTLSYTKRNNKFDVDFIIDLPYRNTLSQ